MQRLIVFFASLALFTAVAVSATSPVKAQPRGNSCFWPQSIQGFRSIDDRTLYLRVSRDVYALRFFAPCIGVDWAHNAGLRSRTGGTICEGRGNSVEIFVRGGPALRNRCQVDTIRRLTPDEVAAMPPNARPN